MKFVSALDPRFNKIRTANFLVSDRNRRSRRRPTAPTERNPRPQRTPTTWASLTNGVVTINLVDGKCSGIRKQIAFFLTLDISEIETYDFHSWQKNRVYRVRTWIRKYLTGNLLSEKVTALDSALTVRLEEINKVHRRKGGSGSWFCLRAVNKLIYERKISRVFRSYGIKDLLPDDPVLANTRVSISLNPSLGKLLSNFTQVSLNLEDVVVPAPENCSCTKYLPGRQHPRTCLWTSASPLPYRRGTPSSI